MTDRIIETEQARDMLVRFIAQHPIPFTATITSGRHRTTAQNKLQRQWINEITEQMAGTFESPEHVRAYCKLHFGIPILRSDSEAFRLAYDGRLKQLPYQTKLELMMEPVSIPVTSIMTTKQKTAYLDAVWRHFSEQGVVLTDPEQRGRAA